MTIFVENETDYIFPFDPIETASLVAGEVLEYRNIDRETDVLSFPNVPFELPSDFSVAEEMEADCFQPDSGELILGDIILSCDRILEQAESFGHSIRREYAFLIAHSMLHLCGYDHMEPDEASVMEEKQNHVLDRLGITRDISD